MNYLFFLFSTIVVSGVSVKRKAPQEIPLNVSQSVKGVAAILVVLYHCADQFGYPVPAFQVGYLAVSCFFFVSAYGIFLTAPMKMQNAIAFWKRKIVTLFVPFFAACLIYHVKNVLVLQDRSYHSVISGLLPNDDLVTYSWYAFCGVDFYGICIFLL